MVALCNKNNKQYPKHSRTCIWQPTEQAIRLTERNKMSQIMTNFTAADMPGAKKATPAPKAKAPKPAPVVVEPPVVTEEAPVAIEETVVVEDAPVAE